MHRLGEVDVRNPVYMYVVQIHEVVAAVVIDSHQCHETHARQTEADGEVKHPVCL